MKEQDRNPEMPFTGMDIYYSGSIKGIKEIDQNFAWQLVQYMISGGANVLSEHVAARNQEEMNLIRAKRAGISLQELLQVRESNKWNVFIRKQDIAWVHQATHIIALVNGPSHGVGMEIQEGLRKPQLGYNLTPTLCLVHEDLIDSLSGMIKGICSEVDGEIEFYLRIYKDLEEAKKIVFDFLTGKFKS